MGPRKRALVEVAATMTGTALAEGTLMRHFLRSASSPGPLPGSVQTRSAVAQLVAFTGAAQRLTPAHRAHSPAQYRLPRSQSQQIRTCSAQRPQLYSRYVFARPHVPRAQHWTTPHSAA